MKLSIFYDHLQEICTQEGMTMPEALFEAKRCGIDGIEIHLSDLLEDEGRIVSEIEKAGMCVSCIYESFDWGNRPDIRGGAAQIDAAKRVGAKKILVIPGFLPQDEADAIASRRGSYERTAPAMEANERIRNMRAALRQVTARAARVGIAVTLEDFDGKTAPFAGMNQLLWFIKQVEGLRFTMDTGNFAFSDEDAAEGYRLLRDYVVHVHCKDRGREDTVPAQNRHNRGLAPCPAGSGYMPIGAVVRDLKNRGYGGFLAVEHFGAADQLEFMRKSAEYLKTLI